MKHIWQAVAITILTPPAAVVVAVLAVPIGACFTLWLGLTLARDLLRG